LLDILDILYFYLILYILGLIHIFFIINTVSYIITRKIDIIDSHNLSIILKIRQKIKIIDKYLTVEKLLVIPSS